MRGPSEVSQTYDLWLKVEVDADGRITGHVGLKGEEEYAHVYGAQDYWSTIYALTPYIANLCREDPFGQIPRG